MKSLILSLFLFALTATAQSAPADPLGTATTAISTAQGSAKAIADNLAVALSALATVQAVSAEDAALLAWIKQPGNGEILLFARAQIAAGIATTSSYSFGAGSTLACSSSAPIRVVASAPTTAVSK